jgi:hypothetical protein
MGQPRVKWGQAERFFARHGYEIRSSGGDKIIIAPATDGKPGSRNTVRVGHTSCGHGGTELLKCYLSLFRRAFGVSAEDIING